MAGDKAESRGWGAGVMLGLDEGRSGEEKPQLTSGLYSVLSRHIVIQHISPLSRTLRYNFRVLLNGLI